MHSRIESTPMVAIALLLSLLAAAACSEAGPGEESAALVARPSRSEDGVFQISWSIPGAVVLEEASSKAFDRPHEIYRGTDNASTITGRASGTYFYRVYAEGDDPAAAPTVRVDVVHHSLTRAFGFFTVGLVVFASTVALIVFGDRGASRE